jgi:HAD superfamily hydrolase (TIGR01549 family)
MNDRAVVWDYDGTLVDTRLKNWRVNQALITSVSRRPLDELPALISLEAYQAADKRAANWRELYGKAFGLSPEQVDEAGRLWTQFQLADQTAVPFFDGVAATLEMLKDVPQAIFSQNSRSAILQALEAKGLSDYFALVVGYEEMRFDRQKPAPDGLLYCLEQLGIYAGTAFFVGNHDTDMECARRANVALGRNGRSLTVVALGAEFGGEEGMAWAVAPDRVVRRPVDVVELVND